MSVRPRNWWTWAPLTGAVSLTSFGDDVTVRPLLGISTRVKYVLRLPWVGFSVGQLRRYDPRYSYLGRLGEACPLAWPLSDPILLSP
jgi:hypothetical protein